MACTVMRSAILSELISSIVKKLEDIVPSSHNCDVPHVTCTDYQLIDIFEDGFVSLLTENGNTKDDLRLLTDEALLAQDGFSDRKPGGDCDVFHGRRTDMCSEGHRPQIVKMHDTYPRCHRRFEDFTCKVVSCGNSLSVFKL